MHAQVLHALTASMLRATAAMSMPKTAEARSKGRESGAVALCSSARLWYSAPGSVKHNATQRPAKQALLDKETEGGTGCGRRTGDLLLLAGQFGRGFGSSGRFHHRNSASRRAALLLLRRLLHYRKVEQHKTGLGPTVGIVRTLT